MKDSQMADLVLASHRIVEVVSDIPGASIVSDNVELDMSKFGEGAVVKQARFGSEIATLSESSGVYTLDFTSAVAATDLIEVDVKIKL